MAQDYTIRDMEKYQQALQKAINGHETPVKQKHVRSAIIGTFHTQGGAIFWSIALRLPAMDDRIVAWKLCHVVHKILREGHPLCLVESQRHKKYLDEIGKLWCHIHDGYGQMIRLYTRLLITKLDFHRHNPRFPGHLGVTADELESIAGNDINNYFEMSVEMFDYLDNILELQAAVFGSLNMARSNSMTNSGQCRLSPLVSCIQDASKLYDYCVKILFKLHCNLPPDTLTGHRDRFHKIFKVLKEFYNSTMNLQYFKDLISIPSLPDSPPNFLIQSEFRTYVTQEVVVPQEPEEEPILEGSLIDTSEISDDHVDRNSTGSPAFSDSARLEMLREKEFLRTQCEKLSLEVNTLLSKHRRERGTFETKIKNLESEMSKKDGELSQERQVKEELMNQAFASAQSNCEQKVKEEKFEKLKDFYYKLRGEHIQKLREKGEVDKQLKSTLLKLEETEVKLNELQSNASKAEEKLQMATVAQNEELEGLKRDKELFNMETEILKKSINDSSREIDDLRIELKKLAKEKVEVNIKTEEVTHKLLECEKQLDSVKIDFDRLLKEIVSKSIESNEKIVEHAIHEVDNPAYVALTCNSDYLKSLTKDCLECLNRSTSLSYTDYPAVVTTANQIGYRLANFILQGRATCNTSRDITFGDKMADSCKNLGNIILKLLRCIQNGENTKSIVNEAKTNIEELTLLGDTIGLSLTGENKENLADMLETEMAEMDKAIEQAAKKIEEMLTKSRAADSGIKLEVNSKILDSCTTLMQAVRILVQKSRLLQAEIVGQGRGSAGAKEFYKRNHQWTDGFISAAKAVAAAAKFILTAADKVVTQNGKFELLMVAAQEAAASTAQLVVASRVKADRKSDNLYQLTQASKGVTSATGSVVATTKDCRQLVDEVEELDTSNLTLHQAKKLEMESQVRVLELEKELEEERFRLAALRKHHYQLAGDG